MSKRILSIDGGGIKGIVSAIFLSSLEERLQYYSRNPSARLADYFDLIAGTSTGSILTVLYLYPNVRGESKYSAREAIQFFQEFGPRIFKRQPLYPLIGAKYTNKYLEQILTEMFHEDTLCDLRRPCLIPAYDIAKRQAVFFNSVSSRCDEFRNYTLKEAVLSSAAAPTYFPPINLMPRKRRYQCLVDGGVVANNPSMCALAEGLKLAECHDLRDILFVSVGNVKYEECYSYDQAKRWGVFHWAQPILAILMDGSEQIVDYQMRKLYQSLQCAGNYYRFESNQMTEVPKMDDCSEQGMQRLAQYGEELVKKERMRIDELAKRLIHEGTSAGIRNGRET